MKECSKVAQWHVGSSRAPLRTRQRQTGSQVTICKAFHLPFSRGWSASLPRPLQGRVSEITQFTQSPSGPAA
jgi:hypothetical protein